MLWGWKLSSSSLGFLFQHHFFFLSLNSVFFMFLFFKNSFGVLLPRWFERDFAPKYLTDQRLCASCFRCFGMESKAALEHVEQRTSAS